MAFCNLIHKNMLEIKELITLITYIMGPMAWEQCQHAMFVLLQDKDDIETGTDVIRTLNSGNFNEKVILWRFLLIDLGLETQCDNNNNNINKNHKNKKNEKMENEIVMTQISDIENESLETIFAKRIVGKHSFLCY